MSLLKLENVGYTYDGKKYVLDNISLDFDAGSIYSVIGRSGAGKTTLLSLLSGLASPSKGIIYYNGKNPFAAHPLCWLEDEQSLFIVHPQFVLNSAYNFITETLEKPENEFADKYKKVKAEIVERLFLKVLTDIFGEQAKYHTSVCEERGTKEHDILIEFDDYILIVE